MKYTSAEAAKLLRKLNEEYQALVEREQKSAKILKEQLTAGGRNC